ncbi:MAG TPA: hypothetical protein VFU31_24630 [Candidatus Binatia bacterium]|nr:hypothetical protein [Candidatus Binatia bacterium]
MHEELSRLASDYLIQHDVKEERATLAQRIIVALGVICGAALLMLALEARAEEIPVHVFEDEGVTLQLFAAPCEDEKARAAVINSPLNELTGKLQKAASWWSVLTPIGPTSMGFAGCWVEFTWRGKQGYAVAFEDGEIRFFPADGFKKTKGQIGT